MDKHYACYCGLYCGNCAMKTKVFPAAATLRDEMEKAGFARAVKSLPDGDGFWSFLGNMVENWTCASCRDGSGNPGCRVRDCARAKDVEMCALCGDYPCERIDNFDAGYPILKQDNALLRDRGWEAWGRLQDERQANGFTYADEG